MGEIVVIKHTFARMLANLDGLEMVMNEKSKVAYYNYYHSIVISVDVLSPTAASHDLAHQHTFYSPQVMHCDMILLPMPSPDMYLHEPLRSPIAPVAPSYILPPHAL